MDPSILHRRRFPAESEAATPAGDRPAPDPRVRGTHRVERWAALAVLLTGCLHGASVAGRTVRDRLTRPSSPSAPARVDGLDESRRIGAPGNSTSVAARHGTDWASKIRPEQIAIVQFEGRSLWSEMSLGAGRDDSYYMGSIWGVSIAWNWLYSRRHGHEYILYRWGSSDKSETLCRSKNNQTLAEPWCKVKALLQVQEDLPSVDYFLYVDTDAVVDHRFLGESLTDLLRNMTGWVPGWDVGERPFVFTQEGPCKWCNDVLRGNFPHCLNTGVIFWKRSEGSTAVLERWWSSADDSYDPQDGNNPLGIRFRTDHPWEQAKALSLLRDATVGGRIQVFSQPDQFLQSRAPCLADCLVHGDELGCFIVHYCLRKRRLLNLYGERVKRLATEDRTVAGRESCYRRAILTTGNDPPYRAPQFDGSPCPRWDRVVFPIQYIKK